MPVNQRDGCVTNYEWGKLVTYMRILGISAFYHDSAAGIIVDGNIVAAAQEERFTRIKNDASFPVHSVRFCLSYSGYALDDLDAVVFYDKPFLKFERLLETYFAAAPKGIASFIKVMPVWLKQKLFMRKLIHDELEKAGKYDRSKMQLLFSEHHLSHAASAYFPSPYPEAAVLTIDGVGEWATASIGKAAGNQLTVLKELHFPHSLGLLYSAFTYFLGFKVNNGEYKIMGLAPYGSRGSGEVERYTKLIRQELVDIGEDGSLFINQQYFDYAVGSTMINGLKWGKLFGFPGRKPEASLEQHHCNLALAIQEITEEVVLKMAVHAKELTGSGNLCMAGGVALNCVANGKLQEKKIFRNIYIQPAAGDAGGAIGAALSVYHIYFNRPKINISGNTDIMHGAYLGPEYSESAVEALCRKHSGKIKKFDNWDSLYPEVAALLSRGQVVAWFQGRTEFGPRALGARSILADARDPGMQEKLNLKVKFREGFRPFAPVVLEEEASYYFELDEPSPYMLFVKPLKAEKRIPFPEEVFNGGVSQKLRFVKSDLPAITHVDYSARVQTLNLAANPRLYRLLLAFKQETGCGVLINTSFNVRDEPIVNSPEEAYGCFMKTNIDFLVINNYLFSKAEQLSEQQIS
jgi:carbamoyltransferase